MAIRSRKLGAIATWREPRLRQSIAKSQSDLDLAMGQLERIARSELGLGSFLSADPWPWLALAAVAGVFIALYERNVAEGFPGDLPYGRLVAIYERQAAFDQAERVLRRAIAVFESSARRTPRDRRATVRVFKNRLAALLKRPRHYAAKGYS